MTEEKSRERGAVVPLSKELTTDRALAAGSIGEIGVVGQLYAEMTGKLAGRTVLRRVGEKKKGNRQGRQERQGNAGGVESQRI